MNSFEDITAYLKNYNGRPIKIMEVCGTHTAAAFKGGIRGLISEKIRLVSGPGCPVCLAAKAYIDRLIHLSLEENCIIVSFGDLLKVKGSHGSLDDAKAKGAKVVLLYSPLDVLQIAKNNPENLIVMAAVGFETTAPLYTLLLQSAEEQGLSNIRLLTALKRLVPALNMLCEEKIDGFIAPGHVASIIGSEAFIPVATRFQKPFAVTGFTPENMLMAIWHIVREIKNNTFSVTNLYGEAVRPKGNEKALKMIEEFFEPDAAYWRGLAEWENSGLYLKKAYERFDAGSRGLNDPAEDEKGCRCSKVLTGAADPTDCPLFGRACTPQNAHGPCMVSAEGACGIWFKEGV